jgi:hypothetical protein
MVYAFDFDFGNSAFVSAVARQRGNLSGQCAAGEVPGSSMMSDQSAVSAR